MIRYTLRRSRKERLCDGYRCGTRRISAGSSYVESVASPMHEDLDNTRWWRLRHCLTCAAAFSGTAELVRERTTMPPPPSGDRLPGVAGEVLRGQGEGGSRE